MHRALAILKYAPAVLCGLLVVAWVVSLFRWIGMDCRFQSVYVNVSYYRGSLLIGTSFDATVPEGPRIRPLFPHEPFMWLGAMNQYTFKQLEMTVVPVPFILSLLLPTAVGPFTRFRFPVWSYFAWTALVAVELAYYLR